MAFVTEKETEELLEEETRIFNMPDGSRCYMTMSVLHWNCLKTLLYFTTLDSIINQVLRYADEYGYSFKEYFPHYIAWYNDFTYNGMRDEFKK
jgi:hypothetical protein